MSEFETNNIEETEAEETVLENDEEYKYVDTGSAAGSILGGLVGMIIALLICTVVHGIFGKTPFILYFLFPLCICVMSLIFSGSLRQAGLIIGAVFTFLGIIAYPAFSAACESVLAGSLSPLSIPLVAIASLGEHNLLGSISFTSQFVYPVVIAIIGIAVMHQVYKLKIAKLSD